MQKLKLPKYAGDVREYTIFKVDFKHAIEARYNKRDSITFFRACLQTEWKTVTENNVAQNRKTKHSVKLSPSTSAQKQCDQNRCNSCFGRSRCSSPSPVSKHLRPEWNTKERKHLLDSGAQISLIRSDTAELLGLKGMTTEKVDRQKEIMRRKE